MFCPRRLFVLGLLSLTASHSILDARVFAQEPNAPTIKPLSKIEKEAVVSLIKLVRESKSDRVRQRGFTIIARLAPRDSDCTKFVTEMMDDQFLQISAIRYFAELTTIVNKEKISRLLKYVASENERVSGSAISALEKIGPDAAKEFARILASDMYSDDLKVNLLGVIRKWPHEFTTFAPALKKMLKSETLSNYALATLANFGASAKDLLPDVIEFSKSGDEGQQYESLQTIAALLGTNTQSSSRFSSRGGRPTTIDSYARTLIARYDSNKDGEISEEEITKMPSASRFDLNRDKVVTLDEIKRAFPDSFRSRTR